MKIFTKKERLAIYKKLLNEVDKPVIGDNYYLCWKLYIELVGLEKFMSERTFGHTEMVLSKFPEFKKAFEDFGKSILTDNDQRREILRKTIFFLCEEPKKIKLKQLENWLGDDDKDELKRMLLNIANGEYLPEMLRQDILSYE
jgi:hypothetical protein